MPRATETDKAVARAKSGVKMAEGVGHVRASRFSDAVQCFSAALELDPANVDAADALDEAREMFDRDSILSEAAAAEASANAKRQAEDEPVTDVPLTPEPPPATAEAAGSRRMQKMREEQEKMERQNQQQLAMLRAEKEEQEIAARYLSRNDARAESAPAGETAQTAPPTASEAEGGGRGEGWIQTWGRKLGMSEAQIETVDRRVTKIQYQAEQLIGHPGPRIALGRATDKVNATVASSDAAVIFKRDVLERLKMSPASLDDVSGDPELALMVAEFRSVRAFLREVAVFMEEAAHHVRLELETEGVIAELLRAEAGAEFEHRGGAGPEDGAETPRHPGAGIGGGAAAESERLRFESSLSAASEARAAEMQLRELMADVAARSDAIAAVQRRFLESAPAVQAELLKYLDVISPDTEEVLARYERARLKYDAFRAEVEAAEIRGDDAAQLGRIKSNRDEAEMVMMKLQQTAGFKLALCRDKVVGEVTEQIGKAWVASSALYVGGAEICHAFYTQREQAFAATASY